MELMPLQNDIFRKPISEPLHKVISYITKIVSNSLGALITLALNGYGSDAMRIARSMFEGAVTVGYLKLHPDQLDDYLDFHWIRQKRLYDYTAKYQPEELHHISPDRISEMEKKYKDVAGRFTDRRGKVRGSWSKVKLRQMAEEVGKGQSYPTFYALASSMHHLDIGGLSAHSEKKTFDVDVAPSLQWLNVALIMGHNAVLSVLASYNEVAQLGMDRELETAVKDFKKTWEKSDRAART